MEYRELSIDEILYLDRKYPPNVINDHITDMVRFVRKDTYVPVISFSHPETGEKVGFDMLQAQKAKEVLNGR